MLKFILVICSYGTVINKPLLLLLFFCIIIRNSIAKLPKKYGVCLRRLTSCYLSACNSNQNSCTSNVETGCNNSLISGENICGKDWKRCNLLQLRKFPFAHTLKYFVDFITLCCPKEFLVIASSSWPTLFLFCWLFKCCLPCVVFLYLFRVRGFQALAHQELGFQYVEQSPRPGTASNMLVDVTEQDISDAHTANE